MRLKNKKWRFEEVQRFSLNRQTLGAALLTIQGAHCHPLPCWPSMPRCRPWQHRCRAADLHWCNCPFPNRWHLDGGQRNASWYKRIGTPTRKICKNLNFVLHLCGLWKHCPEIILNGVRRFFPLLIQSLLTFWAKWIFILIWWLWILGFWESDCDLMGHVLMFIGFLGQEESRNDPEP